MQQKKTYDYVLQVRGSGLKLKTPWNFTVINAHDFLIRAATIVFLLMLVHLCLSDDKASNSSRLRCQIFMKIFTALNAQWATKILRWAIKCKPQATSLENLICTILSIKDIVTPKLMLIKVTIGRWTREENCKYGNKNSLERLYNRFLKCLFFSNAP